MHAVNKRAAIQFTVVLGILIVYLGGGVAVFTGLSTVFDYLGKHFASIPDVVLYGIELILGIILVVYGITGWRNNSEQKQVSKIPDVSTWALISLGAGGTLTDLPTAIPYFGFIAKMTEMKIDIVIGIALIFAYCIVYRDCFYSRFVPFFSGYADSMVTRARHIFIGG